MGPVTMTCRCTASAGAQLGWQVSQVIQAQMTRGQLRLRDKDARGGRRDDARVALTSSCARQNMAVVLPPPPVKLTISPRTSRSAWLRFMAHHSLRWLPGRRPPRPATSLRW